MANDPKKPDAGIPWDDADESVLNSLLEGMTSPKTPLPEEDDSTSLGTAFSDLEATREEDSTASFAPPTVHARGAAEEDDSTAIAQFPPYLPPAVGPLPLPASLSKDTRSVRLPLPSSLLPRVDTNRPVPEIANTPPYGSQVRLPLPVSLQPENRPPLEPDPEPTPTMRFEPGVAVKIASDSSMFPSAPRSAPRPNEQEVAGAPAEAPREDPAEATAAPIAVTPAPIAATPTPRQPTSAPISSPAPKDPASKPTIPAAVKPAGPALPSRPLTAPAVPKPGEAKPAAAGGASALLARLRATREAKPAAAPPAAVAPVTPEPLPQSAAPIDAPVADKPTPPIEAASPAVMEPVAAPERAPEPTAAPTTTEPPSHHDAQPSLPAPSEEALRPTPAEPVVAKPPLTEAVVAQAIPAVEEKLPEPPTYEAPSVSAPLIASKPASTPTLPEPRRVNLPSSSGSGAFKPAPETPRPPPPTPTSSPSGINRVMVLRSSPSSSPEAAEELFDIEPDANQAKPRAPEAKPPPVPVAPPRPIMRPVITTPAFSHEPGGGLQEDILDILREEVPQSPTAKAWQPQPTSIKRMPVAPRSAALNFDMLPVDSDVAEIPSVSLASPFSLSYQESTKRDLELIEAEFAREHEPKRRSALAFEAGRVLDELLSDGSAARGWFEKALRANPQNRMSAHSLRMTAEREGELELALEAIRRELALTTNPAEQSAIHLDSAEIWRRLGNEAEVKGALKRAAETSPEDARAQYANILQHRLSKQWDAYAQSVQRFSARSDVGALGPALSWDLGVIEEFIRGDATRAEAAYLTAEKTGEEAAQSARERLALKRGDFSAAAHLAPHDSLAAACLRASHQRETLSEALQNLARLPASVASILAQDPQQYEALSEHLSTASAQGAALAMQGILQQRPALLATAQRRMNEVAPLTLSVVAKSTPAEAAGALLPLFPGLRGFLLEHYAQDPAGALAAHVEHWKQHQDLDAQRESLRLMLQLKSHDQLLGAPLSAPPPDEAALRALERFDALTRQGNAALAEEALGALPQEGLRALAAALRPASERAQLYLALAQNIQDAPLKAALYSHAARYLEAHGDNHRALDALLHSLELQPAHRPTREAALWLASQANNHALYRSLRASELSLRQDDPKRSASISYELGALREEEGDLEGAATHYLAAIGLQEAHTPALLALARLASQRRDAPAQAKYLTAILAQQEDPTHKAATMLMLGELYAGPLASPEKAQLLFKDAWGASPAIARTAARALEILCSRQDDPQTLGMIYQSALASEPPERHTEFLVRLATLATELGSHEIAGRFYYDALQQNPAHYVALLGLSQILLNANRPEDVQRLYQQAAATSQTPAQKAAFELNALALYPETPEAAQFLGRFFAAAPLVPLAQQSAISAARRLQDWTAEASVYRHLALLTDDAAARAFWKTREGEALLRQANPEAIGAFTEALALQPDLLAALRGQETFAKQHQDTRLLLSTLERLGEVLADPREAGKALLKAADLATQLEPDGARARQSLWKTLQRDPKNLEAFTKLRATLSPTSHQDALTIKQVIEQRLEAAAGEERRLLLGELASLCRERLNDPQGARLALRELVQPETTPYQPLVDLAELEEQAKEYEAAASLYLRILRLPRLTAKQRRDAYWHSGIIYDEHVPDLKRALASFQYVLSLGGLGEKEAALRLAKLLVKTNERNQAADMLFRVASAEPDPKARLAFLVRVTKLWTELDDKMQAISACQRALTIDEHHLETIELLAELYQKKGDDKARHIHLSRVVLSYCQNLRSDPNNLESYQALVRVFRLMNAQTRAAAAATLYCAFGGEQADIRALAQTTESWQGLAPEKLNDPALREKLQHRSALPSFKTLLSWLGDVPKRAFPSELWKHGVGTQDRLSGGPAFTLFQTLSKPLGVTQFAVYNQKLSPFALLTEPSSPIAFVLGGELLALPAGAELRFVVARSLYVAGQGPIYALALKPQELRDLLAGVALALNVTTKLAKTQKAEEISRLAAPALAKRDSMTAASLVLESLRGGEFLPDDFAQGVKHEANRCALLLTGSLRASLEALARIHGVRLPRPGEPPAQVIAQSPEFNELIQFILSEDFALLRGK